MDEIKEKEDVIIPEVVGAVKHPKGHHPNSRANLKPFGPNNCGNPLGAGAHDPIKKAMKKMLTAAGWEDALQLFATGTTAELAEFYNDESKPGLQRGVAKFVYEAIKNGDWENLKKVVDELLGKAPIRIELNDRRKNVETHEDVNQELLQLLGPNGSK